MMNSIEIVEKSLMRGRKIDRDIDKEGGRRKRYLEIGPEYYRIRISETSLFILRNQKN